MPYIITPFRPPFHWRHFAFISMISLFDYPHLAFIIIYFIDWLPYCHYFHWLFSLLIDCFSFHFRYFPLLLIRHYTPFITLHIAAFIACHCHAISSKYYAALFSLLAIDFHMLLIHFFHFRYFSDFFRLSFDYYWLPLSLSFSHACRAAIFDAIFFLFISIFFSFSAGFFAISFRYFRFRHYFHFAFTLRFRLRCRAPWCLSFAPIFSYALPLPPLFTLLIAIYFIISLLILPLIFHFILSLIDAIIRRFAISIDIIYYIIDYIDSFISHFRWWFISISFHSLIIIFISLASLRHYCLLIIFIFHAIWYYWYCHYIAYYFIIAFDLSLLFRTDGAFFRHYADIFID